MSPYMKRAYILFIAVSIILIDPSNLTVLAKAPVQREQFVYICYSASVDLYHKDSICKDLFHCKQLIKVSLSDASKKYHRKPCKLCSGGK